MRTELVKNIANIVINAMDYNVTEIVDKYCSAKFVYGELSFDSLNEAKKYIKKVKKLTEKLEINKLLKKANQNE